MRDLAGLSWNMVAIAAIAVVVIPSLIAIAQAFIIRSLRRQLAEAEDDIEQLQAVQDAGAVTFLKVHHHG
jgi:hypothetical protein